MLRVISSQFRSVVSGREASSALDFRHATLSTAVGPMTPCASAQKAAHPLKNQQQSSETERRTSLKPVESNGSPQLHDQTRPSRRRPNQQQSNFMNSPSGIKSKSNGAVSTQNASRTRVKSPDNDGKMSSLSVPSDESKCRRYQKDVHNCNSDWTRALEVVSRMKEDGHSFLPVYAAAIYSCERGNEWKEAVRLFKELRASGLTPYLKIFDVTIKLCTLNEQWHTANNLYGEMRALQIAPNKFIFQNIIKSCSKVSQPKLLRNVILDMRACGIEPNVSSYNVLINCLSKSADAGQALDVLHEMKEHGISPDAYTYNFAINACKVTSQLDKALSLLDEMQTCGLVADVFSYTSTISICANENRIDRALELLEQMKSRGIKPNVVTFSAVLNAFSKKGEWEKATQLLSAMKRTGVQPNEYSYSSAISACEVNGSRAASIMAVQLFGEMKNDGVEPNTVCFNALVSACAKSGWWEECFQTIKSMEKSGLFPDVKTFSSAMDACSKTSEWEKTFRLFEMMKARGILPDKVVYSLLIVACDTGGQWQRALQYFQEMQLLQIKPDVAIFRSIINSCVSQSVSEESVGAALAILVNDMPKFEILPCSFCYAMAVYACARVKRIDQAEVLLERLMNSKLDLSETSSSKLLEACHILELNSRSYDVLTLAQEQGFFLTVWKNDRTIDFHLCSVPVSICLMQKLLRDFKEGLQPIRDITIVTGRGIHNQVGTSVLGPALRSLLRSVKGPRVVDVQTNDGVFILTEEAIRLWLHMK